MPDVYRVAFGKRAVVRRVLRITLSGVTKHATSGSPKSCKTIWDSRHSSGRAVFTQTRWRGSPPAIWAGLCLSSKIFHIPPRQFALIELGGRVPEKLAPGFYMLNGRTYPRIGKPRCTAAIICISRSSPESLKAKFRGIALTFRGGRRRLRPVNPPHASRSAAESPMKKPRFSDAWLLPSAGGDFGF